MASRYSKPPIEPFCQPPDDTPRPEQTLYIVSKEDQERLTPYLPPKRIDFLQEKPVLQGYTIAPNKKQPYEVLNAFTESLKRETDPSTFVIVESASTQWVGYWYQKLTPEQVEAYGNDPAVADISTLSGNMAYPADVDTSALPSGPRLAPTTGNSSSTQISASKSLPHVTLTYAQSLDSQLSLAPGQRTTLSGLQTKAMTHFLRANHDAILIGAGTANADNPGLNTSFSYDGEEIVGLAEQPRPLILDPGRSWREESCEKIFNLAKAGVGRAPWWVICEDSMWKAEGVQGEEKERDEERIKKIKKFGGDVIKAGSYLDRKHGVEWEKILMEMWNNGIRSVMIEGGATVINDLLRSRNQHLVTSVIVTIAPTYLGSGGVVVAPPRSKPEENEARLSEVTWIPFGQDVVMAGRLATQVPNIVKPDPYVSQV